MQAAKIILEQAGINSIDEMAVNENYTVEVRGFMDLTIEKLGQNRVSVAHYRRQNGDLMSDPEIVFNVIGSRWIPVRFTQHPHIHQFDETGLDLSGFVKSWSNNLHRQGFIKGPDTHSTSELGSSGVN